MADIPGRSVQRDDFDAALVPGFRLETRGEYHALDRAWAETWQSTLGPDGEFAPGVALRRDCPLCGASSATARQRYVKLGMRIVTCLDCGLTYSREILTRDRDRELYRNSSSQSSYRDLKRNEAYARLERLKCRYILQSLTDFRAPPGRLLDVGSGSGRLLQAAVDAGWNARGIEADPEFAQSCRAAGLWVVDGFFPDDLPEGDSFDAIAMLDVLEHSTAPIALLQAVRARMSSRGILVLQVPNFNSLLIRIDGKASANFCHGHWNHFCASTLAATAGAAGFETMRIETVISEIDKISAKPAADVEAALLDLTGEPSPPTLTVQWLHEHQLGYKLLGYFRAPTSG